MKKHLLVLIFAALFKKTLMAKLLTNIYCKILGRQIL